MSNDPFWEDIRENYNIGKNKEENVMSDAYTEAMEEKEWERKSYIPETRVTIREEDKIKSKKFEPLRPEPNQKVLHHRAILSELNVIYEKKNHDYGDSFHASWEEEGFAMSRVRLSDKLNRFKTLSKTKGNGGKVSDESIRDTLMDLANYAIMTVMEIDNNGESSNYG